MPRKLLKFNLALKLWLVMFLASSLLVLGLILWLWASLDHGFRDYIERQQINQVQSLKPQLEALYAENNSWQPLATAPGIWHDLQRRAWFSSPKSPPPEPELATPPGPPKDHDGPPGPPPWEHHKLKSRKGGPSLPKSLMQLTLVDAQWQPLVDNPEYENADIQWTELGPRAAPIGYLGYARPQKLRSPREVEFLKRQTDNFAVIGIFSLVITAAFAFPLAAFVVRPIRKMEASTQALSRGEFTCRVDHNSNDELGSLAQHFNHLAETLEANEKSRRTWVADISHELRTPVTFIKGQIEAIIDGIRPASPANLRALEAQINHLSKLIDDLYQLSLSELGGLAYKKQWQPVATIIAQAADQSAAALAERGLTFTLDMRLPDNLRLFIDAGRMLQLLNNLLLNSLRYTDAPGSVLLSAEVSGESVLIRIEDSAPSVADEDLPKLFNRLYRADSSRNSATGGAGIGLALCRNVAEAHHGQISAEHSSHGGLKITVELPLQPGDSPGSHHGQKS